MEHQFIIAAVCNNGARFYSEEIYQSYLLEEYRKFKAMVEFFGGGKVRIYKWVDSTSV